MIGTPFLILNHQVELFDIGYPFNMKFLLKFGLRINEDKGMIISMQNTVFS